jgi:hypothetical protein
MGIIGKPRTAGRTTRMMVKRKVMVDYDNTFLLRLVDN